MNKRGLGSFYEQAVIEFLNDKGVSVERTNFICKIGEIDIIGRDSDTLVFFEVKYRSNKDFGDALDAVNIKKQNTIRRVAQFYLYNRNWKGYIRFDVIGINGNDISWIKNAF